MIALTGAALARARVCLIVVPSFLLFGYNQSNIGGVLSYPSFIKYFPEIDTSNNTGSVKAENARAQGTVVAIYTIGCLIGALGITQIGNRFGRRKSLIAAAIIAAIGQILQISSFSIGQLVVGRIISGIGNGGVNAVVPVWQSECTASKSRGKNVVIIGVFILLESPLLVGDEIAWRFPLALPIIFTLMIMAFTSLFPESPRWLISKGRLEEAHVAMQNLSREENLDDAQIRLASKKAALLNAGVLTWKIFAAISAYLSVDRFGRKPLFIIACLGMGVSMAALSGCVWAIDYRYTFGASVAATFFLFLYMTFFPLGFLGANFLYSAEIAPQDLRIHLAAIGTATHWLFNFVIAEITPVAFVTIKWRYYIVYAVISVSVAAMVYFFFPETNCRSLEEMDELFSDPDHWWQVPSYAQALRTGQPDSSPTKTSTSHIEKV
ncbi:general substrate transporter [Penicillium herquei]|nr:general substrate transporter [Penicillium herquei]